MRIYTTIFLSQQHLPLSERVVYSSIENFFFVTLSFGECLACALDYPLSILETIFNLLFFFQLQYNLFSHAVINLASQFIDGVMLFLSSAATQAVGYQPRNQCS